MARSEATQVARTAWGQRKLGMNVWEAALDRTRSAFKQFDHIVVAFSGGKDSTVVLNLALIVAEELGMLPIHVMHYDEEAIPFETEDYVRRVSEDPRVNLEWYCLPVQHRNACSREEPHWWPWAPEAKELWCRPLPPEAITELEGFPINPPDSRPSMPLSTGLVTPTARYGTVGQLMGIRADESLTRRRAVGNAREENWIIPGYDVGPNIHKVYPIYDWTTADVWTAPAEFGWDTNFAYDLMEMAGIPQPTQRCAPPYGEQPMRGLWSFKCCFPDLWEKMCQRVPGASTAALYARTGLYSYGEVAEPEPGQTWQEMIRVRLEKEEDEAIRTWIANRVSNYIRYHYRQTTEPLVSAGHPKSGVGWIWLYKMVDRGDLKERSWPEYGAPREKYDKARAIEAPDA